MLLVIWVMLLGQAYVINVVLGQVRVWFNYSDIISQCYKD